MVMPDKRAPLKKPAFSNFGDTIPLWWGIQESLDWVNFGQQWYQ